MSYIRNIQRLHVFLGALISDRLNIHINIIDYPIKNTLFQLLEIVVNYNRSVLPTR